MDYEERKRLQALYEAHVKKWQNKPLRQIEERGFQVMGSCAHRDPTPEEQAELLALADVSLNKVHEYTARGVLKKGMDTEEQSAALDSIVAEAKKQGGFYNEWDMFLPQFGQGYAPFDRRCTNPHGYIRLYKSRRVEWVHCKDGIADSSEILAFVCEERTQDWSRVRLDQRPHQRVVATSMDVDMYGDAMNARPVAPNNNLPVIADSVGVLSDPRVVLEEGSTQPTAMLDHYRPISGRLVFGAVVNQEIVAAPYTMVMQAFRSTLSIIPDNSPVSMPSPWDREPLDD